MVRGGVLGQPYILEILVPVLRGRRDHSSKGKSCPFVRSTGQTWADIVTRGSHPQRVLFSARSMFVNERKYLEMN